jgi:hypothetical protein
MNIGIIGSGGNEGNGGVNSRFLGERMGSFRCTRSLEKTLVHLFAGRAGHPIQQVH